MIKYVVRVALELVYYTVPVRMYIHVYIGFTIILLGYDKNDQTWCLVGRSMLVG